MDDSVGDPKALQAANEPNRACRHLSKVSVLTAPEMKDTCKSPFQVVCLFAIAPLMKRSVKVNISSRVSTLSRRAKSTLSMALDQL